MRETSEDPSAARQPPAEPPLIAEPAGAPPPSGRRRLRSDVVLIAFTVLVLLVGWARTWPNLNRDFDHLHGWNAAYLGEVARTTGHAGLAKVGFAAVMEPLYDLGHNYWYVFHHGALLPFVLAPVGRLAPARYEHATLRILGMVVTVAYLLFLYILARRLRGRRFAAWTLFFGAVTAEVFFFGAFTGFDYVGSMMFVGAAYLAYVGWRRDMRTQWPRAAIVLLLCAHFWDFNSYIAVVPIIVDLVWFDPARVGARKWRTAGVVAALPVVAFVGQEFHYRVLVPLLVHRTLFAFTRNFRQTLVMRGSYNLLVSPSFYKELLRSSTTFVAPVGVAVALLFLIRCIPRVRGFIRGPRNVEWQLAFVASTFALGLFLVMFPESTLIHQFTYFQLGIPLALAAAYYVAERGNIVKIAAIAGTILVAFSTTAWFRGMNNTPMWEFETGVGIRLSTPAGASVRVPIAADLDTPMMLYYSNRPLLFDLPPRFTPAVTDTRFDVAFYPPAVPDDTAALFVPVANAVVVDHNPSLRPAVPNVGRVYDHGAWIVWGAGVTASYGDWRMVEVDWLARRPTPDHLGIDIGEWRNGQWTSLLPAKLRGNTIDTTRVRPGRHFRDGYLVRLSPGATLGLRVFDVTTTDYRASDFGVTDIPLTQPPNAG